MTTQRKALATAVLVMVAGMAGCDSGGPGQHAVSGSIRLDGQPLPEGQVSFVPQQGGPGATARISDGSYEVSRSEGLLAGAYRVEISSVRPTGKQVFDAVENMTIDEVKETVPPAYNTASRLEARVDEGGDNVFDFDLSATKP